MMMTADPGPERRETDRDNAGNGGDNTSAGKSHYMIIISLL